MRGFSSFHRILVATLVAGFLAVSPVYGQTHSTDTLRLALARGAEAVKTGDQERAVELLEPVFVNSPSYVDSANGTAAYWLGRALEADDDPDKARSVLRSGVLVMRARDRSNPRLSEAFIHRVFSDEDQTNYGLATDTYKRMLRRLGTGEERSLEEREALARTLRQLALILPKDVKTQAGFPEEGENISTQSVSSVDGPQLLTWWRGQDPLPATKINERLRTHLRRVAHAREEYSHEETSYLGFDKRGEIYVRLGPPDHTVEVNFDEKRLVDMISTPGGVQVNRSDFPENEFWSYGQYDRRTYYIFVEEKEGAPFTVGTVEDLLPSQLQNGFTRGQSGTRLAMDPTVSRGKDRTRKALATLRTIYRQYAPFHPDMAARHDEVANKLSEIQTGMEAPSERSGHTYAQKMRSETRNQDAVAAMRREQHTPQELGARREKTAPLEVAVRTARFLGEDGMTRTEISWAPQTGAFVPGEEQRDRLTEKGHEEFDKYLIRFTSVQKTSNYRNRAVGKDHFRIQGAAAEGTIPARTFLTERGDSTLYHLRLQWDQYLIDSAEEKVGPKIKMATARKDSMKPLVRDEGVLEMSDLKPMWMPAGKQRLQAAKPYPFQNVHPDTPLVLYFEVYHLPFNAEDRTKYTVEYEIEGVKERGALMEFFRGKNEEQTTVSTTQQGSKRKAAEYILLDLSNWEEGHDLSVTVRVKDETTGQEVERNMDFRLVAPQ